MSGAPRRIFTIVLILVLAGALAPARAADVKLTLWRLKTYIPPADKILDTTIQDCSKELGELAPNAEGAVKFGGKFYAVPHYAIPLILFYRKDLVEKVGAQPPDTWEAIND